MAIADLSVIIPARNEMFLVNTIEDILKNMRGSTEIIAVLDGAWAQPAIPQHPRVTLVYHSVSIGQRAAVNEAARISTARFVMKCDAHCAFDEGFDIKLMADYEPDWTVIPRMYNLHVFDWQCSECGNRTYQGPRPARCAKCSNQTDFEQVMVWKPRLNRKTDFARFDADLHFQYWGSYGNRPEAQGDIADVMCFVGACFFMSRDRYWELGGLDEAHGSWGQMGVEISCKSWLSGRRMVVNKKTWFAHLFRTQPGFGFPYPNPGIEKAREHSRWLWRGNNWPKAAHKLDWLIDKFSPVPDWDKPKNKGLVYYTDSQLDARIADTTRKQISRSGLPVVSVSLKPLDFGRNIVLNDPRGYLTMFKQILAGLEASESEIIFFVEHDVLYHPSHFKFIPPERDVFYYNNNSWKLNCETGQTLFYYCNQTEFLCAYRELLLDHYRKRVERVEKDGFARSMGFEPGTHSFPRGVDNYKHETWMSATPNIDLRHGKNLTKSRWRKDQFRNQKYTAGWAESDGVPGWGKTLGRVDEFLEEVNNGKIPME